jgi:hypothetical protein
MCQFGTVGGYFMKISDCGKSTCPDSKNYVPPTTNPTSPTAQAKRAAARQAEPRQ